ncbi:MAG: response regulator [Myxococcales bacterium]|nr:response regulator [Myxococcales bacterium]
MKDSILTVDDSMVMRRIISSSIEVMGYSPVQAKHGKEALDKLEELSASVALILLDWNMPEMNGLETLRAIKADPKTADIPVMMVTTEREKDNVIIAIQSGARHYLTKPFSQQDLVTRMMECLGLGD